MIGWAGVLRTLMSLTGRFRRDEGGQIALIFALAAPAVVLLTVGAIDLNNVQSARTRLQSIADAAALAGANELGLAIDDNSAIERAGVFVAGHLKEWADAPTVTPSIRVFDREAQRVIEVVLDGHTPSFFANMLPPGGWKYKAESRAVAVGLTPLCVLVIGDTADKVLNVKDQSRLQAPECLVHSNRDILVEGGNIAAAYVQAVTSAGGAISPAPGTGAAPIEDPFKDMVLQPSASCNLLDPAIPDIVSGTKRVLPGVHCKGFTVGGNAHLVLEPGEHWFRGGYLIVKSKGRLTAENAVMFFDKDSKFEFKDQSVVNLEGRKTGAYAGMVMAATRDNTQDFIISSDNVLKMLGVIYVPNAKLMVQGSADIARDSAWTVIVARNVQLIGSPSLIINADYAASDVPVPTGVGPRGGGAQLVQ